MTSHPTPLTTLLCAVLVGCWGAGADAQDPAPADAYGALVSRYRAGETTGAATGLAVWRPAEVTRAVKRLDCLQLEGCEAAAVLHLEVAARCFEGVRFDDAAVHIAAGRSILAKLADPVPPRPPAQTAEFLFRWHLAAGYLQQAYAFHADGFASYTAALEIRPGDGLARFARATAVEASVVPDGFGGVLASGSLLPLAGYPPGHYASGSQQQVDDPAGPYYLPLLRFLAKEYRAVLGPGIPAGEARLRLGRVLAARGVRDEAIAELRQVAEESTEPFDRALAHLCLGRLAETAEDAARSYRAATDTDPLLRQAWLGRSEAAWRMHEREAALAALEHAFADGDERLTSWVVYHLGRGRAFAEALAALRLRVMPVAARR